MAVIYAQLLFIPSLIRGATNEIEAELRSYLSASVTISPTGSDLAIRHAQGLLRAARATPGVQAATATTLVGSEIRYGSRSGSWPVLAIDPTSYAKTFTTPREMIEGRFLTSGASNEIVIGIGIAGAGRTQETTYRSSLRSVHVGDRVAVTLAGGGVERFVVHGIYETDLAEANDAAFISEASAARYLPPKTLGPSTIYLKTRSGDESRVIAQLRRVRRDVHYESWTASASSVGELTGSFNLIKSVLNGISLLVAAVTIFIVTYVDLLNRRRTIGIERAIGITNTAIAVSYAIRAVVLSVAGVVVGLGLFFLVAVPIVHAHPFEFPIGPVTLSVARAELQRDALILVVVATIGALIPAGWAVRISLLDAIWK